VGGSVGGRECIGLDGDFAGVESDAAGEGFSGSRGDAGDEVDVRAIAASEWRLNSGRNSKKADRSQKERPAKRKTESSLRMLKLGCSSLSMFQRLRCGKLSIYRRSLF
jgi:hypothetical protein